MIQFPSTFDPSRKYPVLVPVYGGPASASNTARETFVTPSPLTEYGFLVVNVDSRSAPGRGKRLLDQIYLKLGQVEIDDMAAGVRSLGSRPYVDAARVGIFGTSYGGYASVMSLLRHPDVYAAASASSPVTAWNHYDTIYTERYMWTPQENKAGYEAGSAMTYAKDLKGRLMLYYGTADNNVHPSNMMQLIAALQGAGKSFDVQVGPDRGHSGINTDRMMEFFIEALKGPSRILMAVDPRLLQILEQLRASRFAEIKGAHASFSIPVSERLLNEVIAATMPSTRRFATCTCGRRRPTACRSGRRRRASTSCLP